MKLWKSGEIPLYNSEYMNGFVPEIEPYIVENSKACIIVCPGGGYTHKAISHEGKLVATKLNSMGISAFVLDYRHMPYKHPTPVIDAKRALRYVRYLADEFGYEKNKIGIMGFSAGGHLAGCTGVFKEDFGVENIDDIDKESSKPDFMVLCYPVVTSGTYSHKESFYSISESEDEEVIAKLSIEKKVDSDTPPTFLIHAADDNVVPVENSLLMALALSEHNVPFEIHTFAHGAHGFGLADGIDKAPDVPHTKKWTDALINWLSSMNFID